MDGAMGTELRRAGLADGACAEAWNLTRPDIVRSIHQAYVEAGARVLLTNTFQANPTALARHGREAQLDSILHAGNQLARSLGPEQLIGIDVGPCDDASLGQLVDSIVAQAHLADAICLETCSSTATLAVLLRRLRAAAVSPPVLFSWTFLRAADSSVQTVTGLTPEECARQTAMFDVAALGANCGRDIGLDEMIDVVRRFHQLTDLPLFVRPNAGTPWQEGGSWHYPRSSSDMAARLPELLEAGVAMVGGCCGTTPEHIAAFRTVIDSWNARPSAS
jgi:methionine synthase I (cobalamin-dependent)